MRIRIGNHSWVSRGIFFAAVSIGWLVCSFASAKQVEEKFDDGTVHLRYSVDSKSHKNGDYQELFPGGKMHVRGSYVADKKNGAWTTFSPEGKPIEIANYRNDQLDGHYEWRFPSGYAEMKTEYSSNEFAGPVTTFDEKGNVLFVLNYPMPWSVVSKAWQTWAPTDRHGPKMLEEPVLTPPYKAGKMAMESQEAPLKYMMLYRFMSGVTVQNMGIDPGYVDKCQHGAVIEHVVGHLTHTPDRPADMDAAFYKTGYAGTSASNISQGRHNLFDSIDDYMDDSDSSNVARVGHRQWILTPSVQKTGFGYADGFSCLYTFDGYGRTNLNWTYIAYPGPGYYFHPMLRDSTAWSLSLNSQKCKVVPEDVQITVSSLDEHFAVKESADAKIVAVPMDMTSTWHCIIFRPQVKTGLGKFVVQVRGLRTISNRPAPMTYLVDVREPPRSGVGDQK